MSSQTIVHEGTLRPEQEKSYIHLPFDMPVAAAFLEDQYTNINRIGSDPLLTGGNTIDLGIFDARGISYLEAGFRGWSGSERLSVRIGEMAATPGYLAGPLTPGRWHVMLGLYKIAPEGCSYRVEIAITVVPERRPAGALPTLAASLPASPLQAPFAPWLRGELHCHTWHSDGDGSPAERIQLARERGLDFLAVTDHNTISSQIELASVEDPGLILIRGVEVTTFKGHFNVWGIGDWVDFRVQRPEDMVTAIRFAVERGAVTSCNHPKPFGPPWEYEEVANYHCVEVWNGPWYVLNQAALDFWLRQLASGKRLPAIGGSDYHRKSQLAEVPPRAPGTPTVWVYVEGIPDAQAILQAIRQGHVSLSDEPDGPFLDLRAGAEFAARCGDALPRPNDGQLPIRLHCRRSAGHRLQILDQQGVLFERTLAGPDETVVAEVPVARSLFVRAELRGVDDTMKALTNPVYLDDQPNAAA
jgi:hypothetical protein